MSPSSRRQFLAAVATVGVAGSAGCAFFGGTRLAERPPESVGTDWTPPGESWPVADGGPGRSRHAPGAAGPEAVTLAWDVDLGTRVHQPSITVGAATPDRLFYTRSDGRGIEYTVGCIDASDGRERWEKTLDEPGGAGSLLDGTLYSFRGARIVALNGADGRRTWETDLAAVLTEAGGHGAIDREDFGVGLPVPTPETIYVASDYGLHGLDPDEGTEQWRLALDGSDRLQDLAVGTDGVYGSRSNQALLGVTGGAGGSGSLEFDPFLSGPTIAGGRLTVPLDRGDASVWSVPTSALRSRMAEAEPLQLEDVSTDGAWTYRRADIDEIEDIRSPSRAASDGERIFFAESARTGHAAVRSTVFCIDAEAGVLLWRHDVPVEDVEGGPSGPFVSAPAIGSDAVYVGFSTDPDATQSTETSTGSGHHVVSLDPADGRVDWSLDVPFRPRGVAVAGNHLFVGDFEGHLATIA
jgi:outer membrane protein assembly factor BamB